MVWIRRGYGAYVQCKNEKKARDKARFWALYGGEMGGSAHPVIGMFKANSFLNLMYGKRKYEVLHKDVTSTRITRHPSRVTGPQ